MRLGPLKSDSYCDSDDKTQPVQLLVKQRSGSQSVDRLAEAPQSFAHDSKHCNHPNPRVQIGKSGQLFFRPTPSWLPPGRYTRSIVAKDELRLSCKAVNCQ